MYKQEIITTTATGKKPVDLVKGWGTIALIHEVRMDLYPPTNWDANFGVLVACTYEDYESTDTPSGTTEILVNDQRLFAILNFRHRIVTDGMTGGLIGFSIKPPEPIEIAVPFAVKHLAITGTTSCYTRFYYEIVKASKDKIVAVAAKQGLVMEV